MSVQSFTSNVKDLTSQTQAFEFESAALISTLQSRSVSKEDVEGSHMRILEAFKRTMTLTSNFKEAIDKGTTYSNQEEMIPLVEQASDFENRLERALTRLNDTLLTHFPTARIEYGRSCIGPKLPSVSDISDVKFKTTLSKFNALREIRGDGNCFVSAFTTRFIESLINQNAIENFLQFLYTDGIDQPELKNEMINTLLYLQTYPSQLEKILADNQKIIPFISYFRHLAADEMKKNPAQFEEHFRFDLEFNHDANVEGKSFDDLIKKHVLSMGADFSHPMIKALCDRLQFPVRIYDPRLGAEDGLDIIEHQEPKATFCRNGAHYFVLYTPKESAPVQPTITQVQPTPVKQISEITLKCHVPFGHNLFIRGNNNGLNWEKGIPLTEIGDDTWIFRSNNSLIDGEYKLLVDDEIWENGDNRKIKSGQTDNRKAEFKLPSNMEVQEPQAVPVKETRITVKYAAKPGEKLFIRGIGPNLNWDKGIELRHIGNDVWVFETQADFKNLEYKVLLNDSKWESGGNHTTECGKKAVVTPHF